MAVCPENETSSSESKERQGNTTKAGVYRPHNSLINKDNLVNLPYDDVVTDITECLRPESINLSYTKYKTVRDVAEKLRLQIHNAWQKNHSTIIWTDYFVLNRTYKNLQGYQKINHFPGMIQIARKDCLARNIAKVQEHLPQDFAFTPRTWIMSKDFKALVEYDDQKSIEKDERIYIIKPASSCMGRGIQLLMSSSEKTLPCKEKFVVQEYIEKPLLMDGYKFDLRIYVVVTSSKLLSAFVCDQAIVRTSCEKYAPPQEDNIIFQLDLCLSGFDIYRKNQIHMHLTNTSINKKRHQSTLPSDAETNDVRYSRPINVFNEFLKANEYDVDMVWKSIDDIIVKTIILSAPFISKERQSLGLEGDGGSCFEILGFDILVDSEVQPWLLEVNINPYLGANLKMDYDLKCTLLEDTIKLALEIDQISFGKEKDPRLEKCATSKNTGCCDCSPGEKQTDGFGFVRYGCLKRLFPANNAKQQNRYLDLLHKVTQVLDV